MYLLSLDFLKIIIDANTSILIFDEMSPGDQVKIERRSDML